MAATTVSVQQILFKIAEDADETRAAFVRSVTSQTILVLGGISPGDRETFKHALAMTLGGGIRKITGYDDSSETITLESSFGITVSAGGVVRLAWWDARRKEMALAAINEAIRQSWGRFGRETRGSLSIALVSNDADYDLPAAVGELWRVGFLNSAGDYDWRAERDLWRIGGEPGAFSIQFLDNGGAFMPSTYAGKTLYGWYLENEPEVTSESATVRLPTDWFNLASYLYVLKVGAPQAQEGQDPRVVQANWQTRVGQLKADADGAAGRMKQLRPKRPLRLRYERRM